MQNTCTVGCNWTRPILNEAGWHSSEELFDKLATIPEKAFTENGMLAKAVFISGLRKFIVSIEIDGDAVKEARQMTSPGSLFESLGSDYLFMRSRYLQKRKKLKEQLEIVKRIIAGR